MGHDKFTRETYATAHTTYVPTRGSATRAAEQKAYSTGKLALEVDPAEAGVIRRSLVRFDQRSDDLFTVTMGLPVPIEVRLDTTGSMGGNVDVALKVLPDTYELVSQMLPGQDPQLAIGIFGDVSDKFVLCRPEFEMTAEKLVSLLVKMVPERRGGDMEEDPHYGLFGGAYLTSAYINRIGLKRYDFTVSDAPARDRLSPRELKRVFGNDVYEIAAKNGHEIEPGEALWTRDVVKDLLKEAHAFFLQVEDSPYTTRYWTDIFGPERVVHLPSVELLPQVQAVIIGLTEGTLTLESLEEFLRGNQVGKPDTEAIVRSVVNIPIGAQTVLKGFGKGPKAGDVFRSKTDLLPMDPSEVPELNDVDEEVAPAGGPGWL